MEPSLIRPSDNLTETNVSPSANANHPYKFSASIPAAKSAAVSRYRRKRRKYCSFPYKAAMRTLMQFSRMRAEAAERSAIATERSTVAIERSASAMERIAQSIILLTETMSRIERNLTAVAGYFVRN